MVLPVCAPADNFVAYVHRTTIAMLSPYTRQELLHRRKSKKARQRLVRSFTRRVPTAQLGSFALSVYCEVIAGELGKFAEAAVRVIDHEGGNLEPHY